MMLGNLLFLKKIIGIILSRMLKPDAKNKSAIVRICTFFTNISDDIQWLVKIYETIDLEK